LARARGFCRLPLATFLLDLYYFLLMVLLDRLAVITELFRSGRLGSITISSRGDGIKVKVLLHEGGGASAHAGEVCGDVVDGISGVCTDFVCVDRGHRFSSGCSRVDIWMKDRKSGASRANTDQVGVTGSPIIGQLDVERTHGIASRANTDQVGETGSPIISQLNVERTGDIEGAGADQVTLGAPQKL